MRLRIFALAVGIVAAAHTWAPFVLVTGLLLIGVVANQDGVFAAAANALGRVPGGNLVLYIAAMLLVAVTTVFLNLDTSVAFLTPVLIHVAGAAAPASCASYTAASSCPTRRRCCCLGVISPIYSSSPTSTSVGRPSSLGCSRPGWQQSW